MLGTLVFALSDETFPPLTSCSSFRSFPQKTQEIFYFKFVPLNKYGGKSVSFISFVFFLQDALEESMNGSGTEFEIPSGFDEPIGGFLMT